MKIYAANLAEYNSGRMVGDWITPTDHETFDDFNKAIKKATKNADEVAIHDYEDLPSWSFGEYPNMKKLYNFCHAAKDSHIELNAIMAYADNFHDSLNNNDLIQDAENDYVGVFDNFKEYAEQYCYDVGDWQSIPQHLQYYFDMKSYSDDLEHSYMVLELPAYEGVAVFNNN